MTQQRRTAEVALEPSRPMDLISPFLSSMDVKPSSKALYSRTLKQYFNWMDRKGYILQEMTRPMIMQYRDDLLAGGMSTLTVGSYLGTVRLFYEWAESMMQYPNIARGIRNPKRVQQFRKRPLTAQQGKALLEYCREWTPMYYAIINLTIHTGLRTIEVIRANVGDITFMGSHRVLMVQGKGRDEKDKFVELVPQVYTAIKAYLATRGKVKDSDPLFVSTSNNNRGERLTTRTISWIAKTGLKRIGLDERVYTAHSLRHTTAVSILRAGGSMEQVQWTLRHANINTSQIYTATLDEERRLKASGEALLSGFFN